MKTLALLAATALTAGSASAAAIVYESFDYAPGGLPPATGDGLTGSWSNSRMGVGSGELTFPNLVTDSGTNLITNTAGRPGGASATLTTGPGSLLDEGLLDDGAELWFSALVDTDGTPRTYVTIGTGRPDSFDRIGDGATGEGIGVRIENGTLTAHAWYNNGADKVNSANAVSGVILVVGKITWGTESTDTMLELFTPTGDLSSPGAVQATNTFTGITDQRGELDSENLFDSVGAAVNGGGGAVDDIRFGATYEDVVPVIPEPGSLALLGIGSLLVARRRRD